MDRFPSPTSDDPSERLLGLGLVLALVAVAVQTLVDLANAFALGGRHDQLNADAEGNDVRRGLRSAELGALGRDSPRSPAQRG